MSENMKDKIIKYLEKVNMVSVSQLASAVGADAQGILPLLEMLADEGYLRFGGASYESSFLSCSPDGCELPGGGMRNENTMVISQIKEKAE